MKYIWISTFWIFLLYLYFKFNFVPNFITLGYRKCPIGFSFTTIFIQNTAKSAHAGLNLILISPWCVHLTSQVYRRTTKWSYKDIFTFWGTEPLKHWHSAYIILNITMQNFMLLRPRNFPKKDTKCLHRAPINL